MGYVYVCKSALTIRHTLNLRPSETILSLIHATRQNSVTTASASSTGTVAVDMYYPTQNSTVQPTLIGSSLSSPMAPPSDFRRCSIRNCPHFVAEQSSNKMCEVCRGRHRIYASAKRARRKANDAGRLATAEDLVGLNSVSHLQVSNAPCIRIYCLQTDRKPSLKSSCHNPQGPRLQLYIPSRSHPVLTGTPNHSSYPTGQASIRISSPHYPLL